MKIISKGIKFAVECESGRLLRDEDLMYGVLGNFKSSVLLFDNERDAQKAIDRRLELLSKIPKLDY